MAGQLRARGGGGDNCIFAAVNFGIATAIATDLSHGMKIVSTQGTSRNGSAFYPMKVLTHAFSIQLAFADHGEMTSFSNFMMLYCVRMADPDGDVGAMRVILPARNFDRVAVLSQQGPAAIFGDAWDTVTYRPTLYFEGARDPLDPSSGDVSHFVQPPNQWEDSQNFYPTGNLQAGEAAPINLTNILGFDPSSPLGIANPGGGGNPDAPKLWIKGPQ